MSDQEFHRRSTIEDEGLSLLAQRKGRTGSIMAASALGAGALMVLTIPFWLSASPDTGAPAGDDDRYIPQAAAGQPYLSLPSEPAEPAVATAPIAPGAPAASAPDDEARRRAEAEEEARRRAEEEEARRRAEELAAQDAQRRERYRSPMVVVETSQPAAVAQTPEAQREKAKSEGTFQDTNPNDQFLASRLSATTETAKAVRTPRIDALVPQGTMIRAVLETAVNTDLPGMVRAATTENVWSFDGRRVLIPSGTRVIGEYNAGVRQNQSRAFIVWTRLIRSDGISVDLGSIGTDELGRSGMDGDVDNHYLARYGPALLVSVISGAAQALGSNGNAYNYGPISNTYIDASGTPVTTTAYPGGAGGNMAGRGAVAVAQGLAGTTQDMLKASQAIPPTITINQGVPVSIFVRRDLDFSPFYADPVLEVYRALKSGARQ